MSQPWLIFDSHYLCYRAFHSTRGLSYKGVATGVVFGFLKSIEGFTDQFSTDKVIFCFEHPVLYRRQIYPAYKEGRGQSKTPEEAKARESLHKQISALREEYLPEIGFKNVFCQKGMESDDLMAALAYSLRLAGEETILITADSDLYQCLREEISIYSPQKQKLLTKAWFEREYGFHPRKWAIVKAMAGCKSDNVQGIRGVGEITACKHVRGEKLFALGDPACLTVMRNRALVELPYQGCLTPELRRDEISITGWRKVCAQLGMKSLAGRPPIAIRRARG